MIDLSQFYVVQSLKETPQVKVYAVKTSSSVESYVVKEINTTALTDEQKRQLQTELVVLRQVQHPHLLKIIEIQENSCTVKIIMKDMMIRTLQRQISKHIKPYSESSIISVAIAVLIAIDYLHQNKIAHRNIKTSNIFIATSEIYASGLICVGDLTKCKILDSPSQFMDTIFPSNVVTPEQQEGKRIDIQSDIYRFGVVLCAMILREVDESIINFKIQKNLVDFSGYSKQLKDLVELCLQTIPSQRPTASQLLCNTIFRVNLPVYQNQLRLNGVNQQIGESQPDQQKIQGEQVPKFIVPSISTIQKHQIQCDEIRKKLLLELKMEDIQLSTIVRSLLQGKSIQQYDQTLTKEQSKGIISYTILLLQVEV